MSEPVDKNPTQLYVKKGARYHKIEEAGIDEFMITRDNMAPGLWLIANRHLGKNYQLVHKICEVPANPERFAGVMLSVDELALHIGAFKNNFAKSAGKDGLTWSPSNQDLAKEVIDFILKKGGMKFGKAKKPEAKTELEIHRKLDIDL